MEDVFYWPAHRVAEAIRSGEVTASDYLDALLDRVRSRGAAIQCVVTVDEERARREAATADEAARRGERLGPLHGVAMTIKDSFETAGMRTTSGSPALAEHVPARDAVAVARLRAAGAIVYGKTNLPLFAGDSQSYNEIFGTANNPWDAARSPGGSSGGAAGALAAGLTPLELGSDIGGSIRGPASDCGVAGHKPSYGLVPATGHIPPAPGLIGEPDIAVAGPLARSVADLELALDVMAGPEPWRMPAARIALPPPRHESPRGLRVAAWLDDPACKVARAVGERLETAARALAAAGALVDTDARPDLVFEHERLTFRSLLGAAMGAGTPPAKLERWAGREGDDETTVASRAQAMRHAEWLVWNERREQMRRQWHAFFEDWDVLLLPAMHTPAIPHDHSVPLPARTVLVDGESRPYMERVDWAGLTGQAFLPATVVPVGTTEEGLPVGIQIAGPFQEDRTPLAVGRMLEELLGGFTRPPGY
jgi:amidase